MAYTFGKKLQKLRKQHEYTVEELAIIIGVPAKSIYMWECDDAFPEDDIIVALTKLYKLKDGQLVELEEDEQSDMVNYSTRARRNAFINWLTGSFTVMACIIGYLILGFVGNYWHPGWIIFFLIPIVPSFALCITKRNIRYFCFPVALVAAYLLMGFLGNLWHPGWVIFLSIPLYYGLAEGINILVRKKY